MPIQQASFLCPQCRQMRLFTRQGASHLVHALICLFLCGLWIPVWIIIAIDEGNRPYFCSQCGYSGTARAITGLYRQQSTQLAKSSLNLKDIWINFRALQPTAQVMIVSSVVLIFFVLPLAVAFLQNRSSDNSQYVSTPASTYSPPPPVKTATPLPQSKQAPIKKPVTRNATVIVGSAFLKAAPNQNSEVVHILSQDAFVQVIKQQGAWFYVQFGEKQGWLHGNDIRFTN